MGGGGGGACTYLDCLLALSACIIYSMNIIIIVNIVPSRKYRKYKYSEKSGIQILNSFKKVFYPT